MSHKSKLTLRQQANLKMNEIFVAGQSKHAAKTAARDEYDALVSSGKDVSFTKKEYVEQALREKIFSYKTYEAYKKHQNYFLDWCKEKYRSKTLSACRSHVDEWLMEREQQGLSAYTLKLESAALAKLYSEPTTNFYKTKERKRSEIKRSRGTAARDYGFSLSNNKEIIDFERATGLRRSELTNLKGNQLVIQDDQPFLKIKGKGGRVRLSPVIGDHKDEVVAKCLAAGDNKVWQRVPSHMDVHSYRSEYATAIYFAKERSLDELPPSEKYYCKGDMQGKVFDRKALKAASEALGHSRINVVAEHYVR